MEKKGGHAMRRAFIATATLAGLVSVAAGLWWCAAGCVLLLGYEAWPW